MSPDLDADPHPASRVAEPKAARILVVDDAADVRLILTRALGRRGHTVITASSGEEALHLLREPSGEEPGQGRGPDIECVVLDVEMPDMSGFDVCAALKASPGTVDVPVIFLTAHDDPDMVVKGLEVGANDYVLKPIVVRTLTARVDVALRLFRAERRERRARKATERVLKQLAAAKNDLQIAHRMTGLTVLAAGLAHELNSPLGALTANVSFLAEELTRLRQGEPYDAEALQDCLDAASESLASCERISAVVNRMRLYGEKARARSTEEIHLADLMTRLATDVADRGAVAFTVEGDTALTVHGVEVELTEALRSVLENAFAAAAAGPREPQVRVSIRPDVDEKSVVLQIDDTGDGIPEEDLPFVFDPFFTRKQSWRSVGLGLGIALSLLERHMGEISLQSRGALGGAVVSIRLPRRGAAQGADRPSDRPPPKIPTLL